METTGARGADAKGSADSKKKVGRVEAPSPSFDKIDDRASTKTKVLTEILAREESSYLRHWGLNE